MAFGLGVGHEGSRVGRFGGELVEQVGEVGTGIDRVPFGAGAEAHQDRGGLEHAVARDEEPILSSDGQGQHGSFGAVVVDGEAGVVEVAAERRPLVTRVRDRLPEGAFGQRRPVLVFQPVAEPLHDRPGPRPSGRQFHKTQKSPRFFADFQSWVVPC